MAEIILLVTTEHRKEAGHRVVRLREGKGWSQEDLAHKAGVSIKTISRFENGRHEGRRNTVKQIAEALDVDYHDILGEPPAPLGLGAREDQVNSGFEEFREYVAELKAEIQNNRLDIEKQNELLAQQSDLLEQQTELLGSIREENASLREEGAQIREALRLLPAVQRLLEAEAEAIGPQPVELPALADGEDRRAGEDRRRTG